jgi:hypothetical protein
MIQDAQRQNYFNRHEYQEYFLRGKGGRCEGLTTLRPSRAECLGIWEPQIPGTPGACPGLYWDCFTITHKKVSQRKSRRFFNS